MFESLMSPTASVKIFIKRIKSYKITEINSIEYIEIHGPIATILVYKGQVISEISYKKKTVIFLKKPNKDDPNANIFLKAAGCLPDSIEDLYPFLAFSKDPDEVRSELRDILMKEFDINLNQ